MWITEKPSCPEWLRADMATQDEAIIVNETQKDGTMCKPANIDVKVLAALESSGFERVKLELMRMTGSNLLHFAMLR
jgi:hypothetical protein